MLGPMPPGWDKTIDDVLKARKRGWRSGYPFEDELSWAAQHQRALEMERERSELPPNAHYPKQGEIYNCVADCAVEFMCLARGLPDPITDFGRGTILKGERIWIMLPAEHSVPKPLRAYATIETSEEFEKRCVPETIRSRPNYRNSILIVSTKQLNESFRIETAAA